MVLAKQGLRFGIKGAPRECRPEAGLHREQRNQDDSREQANGQSFAAAKTCPRRLAMDDDQNKDDQCQQLKGEQRQRPITRTEDRRYDKQRRKWQ